MQVLVTYKPEPKFHTTWYVTDANIPT